MELLRFFMNLFDVLAQSFGVQVNLAALIAGFPQRFLRLMNPGFMLGQRVVGFKPSPASLAQEGE